MNTNRLLTVSLVLLITLLLTACSINDTSIKHQTIHCSAETLYESQFIDNDKNVFLNGNTQSNELARTGLFSSKLDSGNVYGLGYKLNNISPGTNLRIKIWRKAGSKSFLVFQTSEGQRLSTNKAIKTEDGWDLLVINTSVKGAKEVEYVKAFCYLNSKDSLAYFDDISVEISSHNKALLHPNIIPEINLEIAQSKWKKLSKKRLELLKGKFILDENKVYHKAKFKGEGKNLKSKIRFKGDFLDHLLTDKWSFRVKTKKAFKGVKKFSLQQPSVRNAMMEYLFLNASRKAEILAPKYEFTTVSINGVNRGVYVVEEHFSNHFLQSRNLEKSSIVTWNDKVLWDLRQERIDNQIYYWENRLPLELCLPFKSHTKSKYNEEAFNLLNDFRHGKVKANSVFNIKKLSDFYALASVFGAKHSLIFHNMKFYYDPVSKLFEPIAYDGNSNFVMDPLIIGQNNYLLKNPHQYFLFTDSTFLSAYEKAMHEFTSIEYEQEVLKSIKTEKSQTIISLLASDNEYSFVDTIEFKKRMTQIRTALKDFDFYQYISWKSDKVYPLYFLEKILANDQFVESAHIKISEGKLFNYHHQAVDYIYKGKKYALPAYDFIGYPKGLEIIEATSN